MPKAQVLQVVLSLNPGGTERLVIELVRRLHPQFAMAVCCLDDAGAWAEEVKRMSVPVYELHREPGLHPSLGWQIARLASTLGAKILHSHHYSPFVYSRLASALTVGSRVVFTEHGRLSDAPPSVKRRAVNRWLTRGVRDLYAVSHDLRRHMLAEGYPSRVSVIWNGIDPGLPPNGRERNAVRERLSLSSGDVAIGTVARLNPVKDLETLLRAFQTLHAADPRVHLVVIGDGSERERLTTEASRLGIADRVRWLGERNDVRELLSAFDIYANSSVSEGVSLTLLEAMGAGLPVVATRVGGTPEVVIEGDTGLLCPGRDPRALAAAIQRVLDDPELGRALGRAGRERVMQHFSLDRMVAGYAAAYAGAA